MKQIRNARIFLYILFVCTLSLAIGACDSDSNESTIDRRGNVAGTVTDKMGNPEEGVSVSIVGVDKKGITDENGYFLIENIPFGSYSICFSKKGRETLSTTITSKNFKNDENLATVTIVMLDASCSISGIIYDAKNSNRPFAGVKVSLNSSQETVSSEDGTFLIEDIKESDYTITFTKDGYSSIIKKINSKSFVDNNSLIDAIYMGRVELLRGLSIDDLSVADKWYYNEYRGGRNSDAYPHWDWSTNYMSAFTFVGQWEEQNEGTTLQIRNSDADQNNPSDLDGFDSYTYGSKLITDDNKIMTLKVRTHSTSDSSPAYFGVQIIDLSQSITNVVKVGNINILNTEDYQDIAYDLSAYVGKEIIIAIGIYRQSEGDYYKQLVIRAIRFSDQKVDGWNWLPGSEVVDGWKLTEGIVRSTMIQTKKIFTGISSQIGNRDNYVSAYRLWRGINHIALEWSLVPLKKDPEVFSYEGYVMKTRDDSEVSSIVPEMYIYSKFSIAPGNNQLTLNTRNFSNNNTYFKLSAINNTGNITHLNPKTTNANSVTKAENGCWKFNHQAGDLNNPHNYALFSYDLSQFNGEDVMIVIGVYNCEPNSGENKMAIYRIEIR